MFIGKSKIRKIFWTVLFLVALGLCGYGIGSRVIFFMSVPTSTTVSSEHATRLEFPAVTVCNLNTFRRSYLVEKDLIGLVKAALDFRVRRDSNKPTAEQYQADCRAASANSTHTDMTFTRLLREGGQQHEDFVVGCYFLGLPCNISNDFVPILTRLGTCYTFNTLPAVREVTGSGIRYSLELVLNIEQHEYESSIDKDAGVRVSIHPQNSPPRPHDIGISVPPGKDAFIGITPHVIDDLSFTGNCKMPDNEAPFELLQGFEYSLSACYLECGLVRIAENCKCIHSYNGIGPPEQSRFANLPPCIAADMCCIIATFTVREDCNCQKPCNHSSHFISTSYAAFPDVNDVGIVATRFNATRQDIQQSFLAVRIYFTELITQKETTTTSYTSQALVSDIGGILGLFLGASIISITELLLWLLDEFKDRCLGINDRMVKKHIENVSANINEIWEDDDNVETNYEMYMYEPAQHHHPLQSRLRTVTTFEESTAL